MVELAGCRSCNDGVLLPFDSPEGYIVYFCTNCRARFSGYANEPSIDGEVIFRRSALYSEAYDDDEEEVDLLMSYASLLEEFPPKHAKGDQGCIYCGSSVPDGSPFCSDCWLPAP